MHGWFTAPVVVGFGMLVAAPVSADAFVDHIEWVRYDGLVSLRVYPTLAGREWSRQLAAQAQGDQAWSEVLAHAADADTPGMREQFLCHWQFAELAQPGKTSWNLEPWRPVVDNATMVDAGCNPGAPAEGF